MKFKKSNIFWGLFCIFIFLAELYTYLKTGCTRPYPYEPVCGDSALIILFVYALLGLLGVYLIISGIKKQTNIDGAKSDGASE